MYSLKPVMNPNVVCEVPSCMYTLKPVRTFSFDPKAFTDNKTGSAGVTVDPMSIEIDNLLQKAENDELRMLAERQQRVLQQLAELKNEILSLRTELKLNAKAPVQPSTPLKSKAELKAEPINLTYLQDFVVNASPEYVPYSLLALKNLWKNRLNLHVECFTHSTVPKLSDEALTFQNAIKNSESVASNLPQIKVTLIWKNVGAYTEMITSPTSYVPICGEVNILRYLSRCGPREFNYEQQDNVDEVDSILDACYLLLNKQNIKQRQQILRTLGSKLGKAAGFGGGELSLCDIAFTSAVKQVQRTIAKDINPNMAKCMGRVATVVGL
ncbi:probable aminoacyl tRNA synthase complex-interacting multifunctional protein 2 isoform X1 [Anopheles moucheti]|uniref:probable aminoacyl tRNA synthase complex-interacting multifunctional protein 2 isoform X1 n=1 Tax=Anopheles moucheti TaxID=186751 RepID=UPI0022F0F6CD|nr:probable aminoacyl tRNA synthase complex-interacting multifunctional protein 2 isoform X1 [Anopheles moucheti]XP_052895293.1 probable aminoacyl tRNA synthase complex-interacting multifunctional protein 2 isoform X1 [Anopheles moucheti]